MRITFEQVQEHGIQGKAGADRAHGARDAESREKRTDAAGAYAVNIGSQDMRAQNGTYKKEDMTAEEISMQAGQMDMDVQKMYMAVMSNSMSEEDFNKMLEDGYDVSDVDVETMVTILDQIKVAVAKGGGEITGFTDGLSKETLEQILGSAAYAEALESGLEDGAAAYMVEQQMQPTPENIYRAKYSAGTYQGRKEEEVPGRENPDGKAFWDQIDRVIEEAGLPKNDESREDAVFLLKHDIALTEENLQLYEKLKEFKQGGERISEEELKYRIGMQVYEGKAAFQADLSRTESIYEEAVSLYEAVQDLPQDAAEHALENCAGGKKLTLRDILESAGEAERETEEEAGLEMSAGQRAEEAGAGAESSALKTPAEQPSESDRADAGNRPSESRELLAARRQLEEVRLRMTVEVNVKLLRSGFQIDTAPMEALIERLKAAEEAFAGQGIPQAAKALEKLDDLRGMPAAALSYAVSREISFTIEALHEKGSELQGDFERADAEQIKRQEAEKRYETMKTEVRPDLGDSMRKAFRNVDDILTDMNREPSEENRRAVRMLGYNRLEINEENLERALEMDSKVQKLFRDMKPGKVLQMIRDGVDVLHTDIGELTSHLADRSGSFLEESEDFARFLYKLDKNGGITAEERENYIGIYRLVRQVEKSDGRAQGYLLGSGAELTMENLLSAVRSAKKGNMDYKIDENFAGVDALQRGKSIIDQINAAPYEDPKSYEETRRALEEPWQKMRQAQSEAAEFLKEVGEPVTVSNLTEASSVLQEEAGIYRRLEDWEKRTKQEDALAAEQSRFESYVAGLQDAVTDEETLQEGMEAFAKQAEQILRDAEKQTGVTDLDIRDLQRLYRGVRFRTALSKESRYQIPLKLETGYTVMNLTVKKGTGTAQAEISVETEKYGRLEAVFTESREEQTAGADGKQLEGNLFAETADGTRLLKSAADRIKERMGSAGISVNDMAVLQGSRRGRSGVSMRPEDMEAKTSAEKNGQKEISAGELYQIAKIFLETVRNE